MNQKANKLILLFFIVLFSSCDDTRFFDDYVSLDGKWTNADIIEFSFEQKDTINLYNMFINVRNNNDYPFNNLFVIVKLDQPNDEVKVDTLEYLMANPDGTLLGKGIAATKSNKLWYKENFKFQKSGKYSFSIEQANRENGKTNGIDTLDGITEIGFRIEKK
ncbi:gliding motility lipoprotein GldH [uncultured Flavobacterium sp.]|jgi:gliding motility-associated lipoprotein GldH|uniref:gliding motility lipoprotein GldH n=1 Tax=uncultured Flavobacterium sp. TaxID=165435 RepID=UPI0030CA38DC|tara:strand:- start:3545 stop:4030 length:486 start_codon:yes stop_codon:yes gene_type:complete